MNEERAREEARWLSLAEAKLQADGVDPHDVEAVRDALLRCVGATRLYNIWARKHAPHAIIVK